MSAPYSVGTVGGTGAAAIVCQRHGIPWFGSSAWDAYLRFTGEAPAWDPSSAMISGTRLESAILDWYATERPGWTLRRGIRLEHEHRHGSLDGLLVRDADGVVEIVDAKRAVMRVEKWGTEADPVMPAGYQVQLAWYALLAEHAGMTVRAVALAIYDPWADSAGREAWCVRYLDWIALRPSALDWDAKVTEEVERWRRGEIPAWDGSDAAAEYLATHCAPPRGSGRDERHADDDEAALVRRWLDAKRRGKAADIEYRALGQEIVARLDGKRLLVGEGYVQAQAAGGGRRVDPRLLRERHPDIYAECSRETTPSVALRGYRLSHNEEE